MSNSDKIPKFSLNNITIDARCVSVYDGDTIELAVDFGGLIAQMSKHDGVLPACVRRISCRMYGYNCAEMKPACKTPEEAAHEKTLAVAARDHLRELVLGKIVTVRFGDFDKYGRALVTILGLSGGDTISNNTISNNTISNNINNTTINDLMISGGYGQPYFGRGEKKY